jgi:malate dehydrogenase (oxaloacetate-decarboxylating)
MSDINDKALKKHAELRGKIEVNLKEPFTDPAMLSVFYTPGVAAVSDYVAKNPDKTRDYTWLNNNVAVISDGSAVLGLGDIGPYGALPVMEGKSLLFKHFAGIDAVPIVLDVHSVDEIVSAVCAIAPSFGGINLEDIAAPQCFEIEKQLKEKLPIPIFHDDQHGTAIVVLAGLINAVKVTRRTFSDLSIVVSGVGSAGVAIMKLLKTYDADVRIKAVDSQGIVSKTRSDLNDTKKLLLSDGTIDGSTSGDLATAVEGADVFIGVSLGGLVSKVMVESMNTDSIIFAMANPTPEIMPDEAKQAGAAVVATGRSDFPNQVNNAVCFPGVFRGALDNGVRDITDEHKLKAAKAIANLVENPKPDFIIPSVMDERLVPTIANVIR